MREYKPNEVIVDRAVELWKRMLSCPKYDNGDDSFAGGMGAMLATMIPKNNTQEILDKFGESLKKTADEHKRRFGLL